jgi:heme-degrading monooxygenase HmoA
MRTAILSLLASTITFAAADTARGQSTHDPVMEIVTFRLVPGMSDADFLTAAKATRAMVAAQPGFVRRSLLRDETGLWTDTIHWQSLPQAQAAAAIVMADPAFAAFGAAIDMASIDMRHIPILWQMGN